MGGEGARAREGGEEKEEEKRVSAGMAILDVVQVRDRCRFASGDQRIQLFHHESLFSVS